MGFRLNLRTFLQRPLETDSSDSDNEVPPPPNVVQRVAENENIAAARARIAQNARNLAAFGVRAARQRNGAFHNAARLGNLPPIHNIGPMNVVCEYFHAKIFLNKSNFKCCQNGKVRLDNLSPYPDQLKNLIVEETVQAKNFQENIRKYNSAFAFASLTANIKAPTGKVLLCFRI